MTMTSAAATMKMLIDSETAHMRLHRKQSSDNSRLTAIEIDAWHVEPVVPPQHAMSGHEQIEGGKDTNQAGKIYSSTSVHLLGCGIPCLVPTSQAPPSRRKGKLSILLYIERDVGVRAAA